MNKFEHREVLKTPFVVKLLENPDSVIFMPGRIDQFDYNCLHALLDQESTGICKSTSFLKGFVMGNDTNVRHYHLMIFEFCVTWLYPSSYNYKFEDHISFRAGVKYGQGLNYKNINSVDFRKCLKFGVSTLRLILGIKTNELNQIKKEILIEHTNTRKSWCEKQQYRRKLSNYSKYSSIIFTVLGGIILAKKSIISGYGFIFLGLGSFQLLLSSLLLRDISSIIYSMSLLGFVDLLGIYNWVILK